MSLEITGAPASRQFECRRHPGSFNRRSCVPKKRYRSSKDPSAEMSGQSPGNYSGFLSLSRIESIIWCEQATMPSRTSFITGHSQMEKAAIMCLNAFWMRLYTRTGIVFALMEVPDNWLWHYFEFLCWRD